MIKLERLSDTQIIVTISNHKVEIYTCLLCSEKSLTVSGFKSLDNGVGVFPYVLGPDPNAHEYDPSKFCSITDSVFVGTSGAFDCATDEFDPSDHNFELSGQVKWKVLCEYIINSM